MNMDKLWGYACSGELENLKEYYENGGETNRRYFKFNRYHSLIAGAYRNGNIETVKYLVSVGETITAEEETEIRGFLNRMCGRSCFQFYFDCVRYGPCPKSVGSGL